MIAMAKNTVKTVAFVKAKEAGKMKTNLFNVKHHGGFGPGGWKCACCGPSPGRARDIAARLHKRRMTRMLNKFEAKNEDS
jgi:hypothetical protein